MLGTITRYTKESLLESAKSSDISSIKSFVRNFYIHCLKWKYQESRQWTSWINTIINCSKSIKSIIYDEKSKNYKQNKIRLLSDTDIYNEYLYSIKDVKKIINKDFSDDDKLYNDFKTLKDISDENKVREWLKKNSISKEASDRVDKKKLKEE